ncbi:MAG: hypothetical protein AWM53_00898 [Candidatus Dichloromethanomonas elyunquensis]|nr:MAG: hypothetical protein AWM53_00898 [Candidatus Dichloromethanomonas elyunquensis]
MLTLIQTIQSFKNEEKGQALTEYGLIIALVAVFLIGALGFLAGGLGDTFQSIIDHL